MIFNAREYKFSFKFTGEPAKAWNGVLPPCAQEPRPTYGKSDFFQYRCLLGEMLARWSVNGWEYFESEDDKAFNDASPLLVFHDELLTLGTHTKIYTTRHGRIDVWKK